MPAATSVLETNRFFSRFSWRVFFRRLWRKFWLWPEDFFFPAPVITASSGRSHPMRGDRDFFLRPYRPPPAHSDFAARAARLAPPGVFAPGSAAMRQAEVRPAAVKPVYSSRTPSQLHFTPPQAARTRDLSAAARIIAQRVVLPAPFLPRAARMPRRAPVAAAARDLSWKGQLLSLVVLSGLTFMMAWNNGTNAVRNFDPLPPIAKEFRLVAQEIAPPPASQFISSDRTARAQPLVLPGPSEPAQKLSPAASAFSVPPAPSRAVQKSFRYADKSGFLQVVEYVCAVKPISREEVLAVADVESSMGRNVVSQKSSARGPMQVTDGTFVYLVGRYGANNLPIIADYIDRLPPESSEAVQLRGDLQTLKVALDAMRNGHWSNAEKRKVLQLRFRPIIELLFAVDYLIEQERDLVNKGFSPETSHAYKSFRYFAGPAAGDPILAAYVDPDPTQRDQPVKPILVKVYEGIYTKKHMSPAHAREEALRSAEDVLRKNGQSSLTTVGGFVEKRVEPFMRLTGQYHQLLPPQPAYTYTQPGDNMLALK